MLLRIDRGVVETRPGVRFTLPEGDYGATACLDRELGFAGLTAVIRTGAGAASALLLFGLDGARLEAVIEARGLTQRRTGATVAIAARRLARPGAGSLGLIGCGWQAAGLIAALREALPGLGCAAVSCRDGERLAAFCDDNDCEAAGSGQEAAASDVVVTATSARDPVVRGEWLRDGALVCGVGANEPRRRELDNVVLERASFVCCDSREQAALEAGDLIEPVAQGVLDWLEVHELHTLIGGGLGGRASEADIVVFKACGLAAADLALGVRLVELAREAGRRTSPRGGVLARCPLGGDDVFADRVDEVGSVEQACDFLARAAIGDVGVGEDLVEAAAPVMLADDVLGEQLFLLGARGEEPERSSKDVAESRHDADSSGPGDCGRRPRRTAQPPRGRRSPTRALAAAAAEGHSRLALGIGSPCGSWVGCPRARSMRSSSSSEMTCSSRSASSWTSSIARPRVSAR